MEQNERHFRHAIPEDFWAELRAASLLPAPVGE
jgi:hypothetical protein